MKDLTEGSITRHLITLSVPILIGMVVQVLYQMVDLYFVSQLGGDSVAGVGIANNLLYLTLAITQILNVGVTAMVSHAAGAKSYQQVGTVFASASLLGLLLVVLVLALGYALAPSFVASLSAEPAIRHEGVVYLYWYLPTLALQVPITVMSAAMRGIGVVKPATMIQMLGVLVNIILTPMLVSGIGTGVAFGVMGAGLSSSIAATVVAVTMALHVARKDGFLWAGVSARSFSLEPWRRVFAIGLPSGAEFIMMFAFVTVIYWAIADFGSVAQAGYSIGQRMMQAFFMPALALAFAAPAVIGQNLGAGKRDRVAEGYYALLKTTLVMMTSLGVCCFALASVIMEFFSSDPGVIEVGVDYLRIVSANFLLTAFVVSANGFFQGVGNTWPTLFTQIVRAGIMIAGVLVLRQIESYHLDWVWWVSIASVGVQALMSVVWARVVVRQHAAA